MALISQPDLEARLGRSLTAEEASAFTIINASLQAFVERLINSGVEDVSASDKYFDGGVQHLEINPCTEISAVALVDDDQVVVETLDTTDYTTEPINQTLKRLIRFRGGRLPIGINNIKVTAKYSIYGDTGVLNIVKDAMLKALVSEVQSTNNIKKESIEGYSVEYASTEAQAALNTLKYLFPGVM